MPFYYRHIHLVNFYCTLFATFYLIQSLFTNKKKKKKGSYEGAWKDRFDAGACLNVELQLKFHGFEASSPIHKFLKAAIPNLIITKMES